jgi:hypothetical protein
MLSVARRASFAALTFDLLLPAGATAQNALAVDPRHVSLEALGFRNSFAGRPRTVGIRITKNFGRQ